MIELKLSVFDVSVLALLSVSCTAGFLQNWPVFGCGLIGMALMGLFRQWDKLG